MSSYHGRDCIMVRSEQPIFPLLRRYVLWLASGWRVTPLLRCLPAFLQNIFSNWLSSNTQTVQNHHLFVQYYHIVSFLLGMFRDINSAIDLYRSCKVLPTHRRISIWYNRVNLRSTLRTFVHLLPCHLVVESQLRYVPGHIRGTQRWDSEQATARTEPCVVCYDGAKPYIRLLATLLV